MWKFCINMIFYRSQVSKSVFNVQYIQESVRLSTGIINLAWLPVNLLGHFLLLGYIYSTRPWFVPSIVKTIFWWAGLFWISLNIKVRNTKRRKRVFMIIVSLSISSTSSLISCSYWRYWHLINLKLRIFVKSV